MRRDELKALRKKYKLTQVQAAAMVHRSLRTWQAWESRSGHKMPDGFYSIFLLRLREIDAKGGPEHDDV